MPIQDQAPEQEGQIPHGSAKHAQSPDSKGTETTKAYGGQSGTGMSTPPTPTPYGSGGDNQAVNNTSMASPESISVDQMKDEGTDEGAQASHEAGQLGADPQSKHRRAESIQLYLLNVEQLGEYLYSRGVPEESIHLLLDQGLNGESWMQMLMATQSEGSAAVEEIWREIGVERRLTKSRLMGTAKWHRNHTK
jgi:hypothetical protein